MCAGPGDGQVSMWLQQLQQLKVKQEELKQQVLMHHHHQQQQQQRWQPAPQGGREVLTGLAAGQDVWALQPDAVPAGALGAQLLAAGALGTGMENGGEGANHLVQTLLPHGMCSVPEQQHLVPPPAALTTLAHSAAQPGFAVGLHPAIQASAAIGRQAISAATSGSNGGIMMPIMSGAASAGCAPGHGGQYTIAMQQQVHALPNALTAHSALPCSAQYAAALQHEAQLQQSQQQQVNQQQQQQQKLQQLQQQQRLHPQSASEPSAPGSVPLGSAVGRAAGSTIELPASSHAVLLLPHVARANNSSGGGSTRDANADVTADRPRPWPVSGPLMELLLQCTASSKSTGALAVPAATAVAVGQETVAAAAAGTATHTAATSAPATTASNTTAAARTPAAAGRQDVGGPMSMEYDSFGQVLDMLPSASLGLDSKELVSVIKAALANAQANQLQQQQDEEGQEVHNAGQQQLMPHSSTAATGSAVASPFAAAASQQHASPVATATAAYEQTAGDSPVKLAASNATVEGSATPASAALAGAGSGIGQQTTPAAAAATATPSERLSSLLGLSADRQHTWDAYGALLASLPGGPTCDSLMSIEQGLSSLDNMAHQLETALFEAVGGASLGLAQHQPNLEPAWTTNAQAVNVAPHARTQAAAPASTAAQRGTMDAASAMQPRTMHCAMHNAAQVDQAPAAAVVAPGVGANWDDWKLEWQ